ncbi:hypothetical protein B0A48_04432 [Cryoendolithus antarcticus]|uniref:J domain-containing protein n=1 Tax=Cryoendolithus antarcticus TaxID=1507870 RepID=A0A1V8TFB9_9PEZI|nr:hypothetical protein B0A48_04432 [Cryoendolithus antarcticus]
MPKAYDVKHNYYADLELAPTATLEEVKKQYRKLALSYHPDRNPGKVEECIPKFQAIQAAHEILGDAVQKTKYDTDRRKVSLYPGLSTNATGGGAPRGNPYAATSAYPPPPRRTQPNPSSPYPSTRPQPNAGRPAGADRFSSSSTRPAPTTKQADADGGRANAFRAWQNMNNAQQQSSSAPGVPPRDSQQKRPVPERPMPPPRQDTAFPGSFPQAKGPPTPPARPTHGDRAEDRRSAWAAFQKAEPSTPGVSRSATTRAAKKGGFDPNAPGSDERAAPNSSHYAHRHRSADFGRPTQVPPPPPGPPPSGPTSPTSPHAQRPFADPLRPFRSRTMDEDVPYAEAKRERTPYSSFIGEKTDFSGDMRRSYSTRDATKLAADDNDPRARSSSPPRPSTTGQPNKGPSKPHFSVGSNTSSEVSSDEGAESSSAQETSDSVPLRHRPTRVPTSPSRRFNGASNATSASPLNGPGPGSSGAPPQKSASNIVTEQRGYFYLRDNLRIAYGALPENLDLDAFRKLASTAKVGILSSNPVIDSAMRDILPLLTPADALKIAQYADDLSSRGRFSFPVDHATFQPTTNGKSRSEENINTKFSSEGWDGTFSGTADYFAAPRGTGSRKGSPLSRNGQKPSTRAATAQYPSAPGVATSTTMPPPPRPTVSAADIPRSENDGSKGQVKFSAEEWQKTFSDSSWSWPPPPPKPQTGAPDGSSKSKRPNRKSSRGSARGGFASNGESQPTSAGEASNGNGATDPPTFHMEEPEPMEIDNDGSPATAAPTSASQPREPRLVSVPVPAWRERAHPAQTNGHRRNVSSGTHNPTIKTSLDDLARVAPFNSTASSAPLTDLNHLAASLPFPSQASTTLPTNPQNPQTLKTPVVPMPPKAPTRLSKATWHQYSANFAVYLRAWHSFNNAMLSHFAARELQNQARMKGGMAWLEASGDVVGSGQGAGGWGEFSKGVREDRVVREVWNVGVERFGEAVGGFEECREKVRKIGGLGMLAER